MSSRPAVSFVIPCYNSALMIEDVVARLIATAKTRYDDQEIQIILVDDCSPDDTFCVLESLVDAHPNVTALGLSKNFGQQAALMAGLKESEGEIVVCLDDDGQTPPEEVFKLIDCIQDGSDLVYAKYEYKKHSLFRNFGSFVNEKMAESLIGKPKSITLSSFFAARRFLVLEALRYEGPFPYISGQLFRATRNVANVKVSHDMRMSGASGYSIRKLISLWLNGFTAFSVKPLRVASVLGMLIAAVGMIFALAVVIRRLFEPEMAVGWASTIALILFIGGLILFVLGLMGEYIGRIYISMNKIPQYVVKHTRRNGKR